MSTIRKNLLQFIFAGSFMKRWNDKLRPVELLEVDKQAHKMILAWVLYKLNSQGKPSEQRARLAIEVIEGGIFEYLYRLVITDIKPPVFYQIKSNPVHYQQLTEWVLEQLSPRISPLGHEFWERLKNYFVEPKSEGLAEQILKAAHLYASNWEFSLIKDINPWDNELKEIEESFDNSLKGFKHLAGVEQLLEKEPNSLKSFINQCGQLRFQKRWSQTPRIPETSVLGHMFIVACYAYLFSLAAQSCTVLRANNFFSGLFHDLPELLTRDIISPVKRSVQKIGDLIKEYEENELRRKVFTLLRKGGFKEIADELGYFLGVEVGSEFLCTIKSQGQAREVSREQLMSRFNQQAYEPKDGELLKVCDSLAAFIEAYTAIKNGINTEQLQEAVWRIRKDYSNLSLGNELHIGSLLADFD